MHSRGSSHRLSGSAFRSRVSALLFAMFATMATIYVAGRLWQDAESRVHLIGELDKRTGQENFSLYHANNSILQIKFSCGSLSVDDTLKIIACREQQKKLSALEMELAAARREVFISKHLSEKDGTNTKRTLLNVIRIKTTFGRKKNRDAIRKAWMSTVQIVETVWTGRLTMKIGRTMTSLFLMVMWRHLRSFQKRRNCSLVMLLRTGMLSFMLRSMMMFMLILMAWEHRFPLIWISFVFILGVLNQEKFSLSRPTNGMNQTGGNLAMENHTFNMLQVKFM